MRILVFLLFTGISAGLLGGVAHAAPQAFIVGHEVNDGVPRSGALEARFGQRVRLFAAVKNGRKWYSDAPEIRVRRRKIKPLPLDQLGDVEVSWRLVEPHPHHVELAPPNLGNPAYSNSVLFGPRHGKWLGYDTLEYRETPLLDGGAHIEFDRARPSFPRLAANGGLGTVRYAVTVQVDGVDYSSPSIESVQRGGLSPKVFRVSFRRGDGLLGYLYSLFNVPNVFGSAGVGRRHQTDRHQGADCADVIIGAARKAGAKVDYTSVSGMAKYTRVISDRLYFDGSIFRELTDEGPGEPIEIAWGETVEPGDILLIKYARFDFTGRTWDHIGVLEEDAGKVGVLDAKDPLLHIGYLHGLARQPIDSQGLMVVQLVRFKRSVQRQMR